MGHSNFLLFHTSITGTQRILLLSKNSINMALPPMKKLKLSITLSAKRGSVEKTFV